MPTPVPARPTASPHLVNAHGLTPLHTAMQWGRVACARALVAAGADTRAVTRGGKTPLDLAKYGGASAVGKKHNLVRVCLLD